MRDWYLLALTFAPVLVLGFLERGGVEVAEWVRTVGIGWFVIGALILGWYDGWVQRAVIGIVIFIPLMGAMLLWTGAVSSGWPLAITVLLIAASVAVLVVLGLATGWFAEMRDAFRRAFGKESHHAKEVEPEA
jgi:hypothetical protein